MLRPRLALFSIVFAFLSVGWKFNSPVSDRVDYGKIYLTQSHLFVGEVYKGIRILDITTPGNIRGVGYIPLEGNLDVAVVGNLLYADNYTDLLIFDISDPANPALIDSVLNVFEGRTRPQPVVNLPYGDSYGGAEGCSGQGGCMGEDITASANRDLAGGGGASSGKSGSMSRFAIVDEFLYCIDLSNLIVFDIRQPEKPRLLGKTGVGFGIETLFPYRYYLFIGSQTGMFIYDARDVRVPVKVSEFRHARACDPVVVEGDRAYVTLRNGTICGDSENELHILDITDVTNPVLLKSHTMESPAGIAVVDGLAYICDGPNLRILDVKDEEAIREISSVALGNSYDLIYNEGMLVVVSPNGLYIYDVRVPAKPVRIGYLSAIT